MTLGAKWRYVYRKEGNFDKKRKSLVALDSGFKLGFRGIRMKLLTKIWG